MTVNNTSDALPAARSSRAARRRWPSWLLLAAIVLLGGYFRALGLFSWDEPSGRLHPDERFMVMVAEAARVPPDLATYWESSRNTLNPRNNGHEFYVYGLLPQTLTRLSAVMLTPNEALPAYSSDPGRPPSAELAVPKLTLLQRLLNPDGVNLTQYSQIHRVGRAWSTLFDLGSVVMVFLIGRRLYGRRVGLLAALLLALAVLPIQLAHFFTVDAATGFFTLLTVYWAVRVAQGGGAGSFAAMGLSIGAAMACRVTLATLGIVGVLAVFMRFWQARGAAEADANMRDTDSFAVVPRRPPPSLLRSLVLLAFAGGLSLVTFRVLQPDAFVGTSFFDVRPEPRYVENIARIGKIISGEYDAPPSQQWTGRTPFVFTLRNMVVWGMGLPLGLAAWAGWALAGWQLFRRSRLAHLIPWVWVAFYFLWQGGQFVMTMRYFALLYGLLAVFAAWGLIGLWDWGRRTADGRPSLGARVGALSLRAVPVVVVVGTLLWAFAFTRIYTQPHSRIEASRWIYDNVPPGSAITFEEWDDPLPLHVDGRDAGQYQGIKTFPYAEDEPSKYFGEFRDGVQNQGLLDHLDQADYLVFSSNRVYGSAPRLPMRYPALTRYYQALFEGQLGFELVADITSYPTLFGVPIPDQGAEEAFSVYDHPRVLIFEKTSAYSRERAEQLIVEGVAWNEVYKLSSVRADRVPTALRLTEDQWPAYAQAGELAVSLAGRLAPWLAWLAALEALGLAMFALLFRLLPRLPDRGFALSKTLGLLLVAYGAWLLGSFGWVGFSPLSVWLCAGPLLAAGAIAGWRGRRALLDFARERRRALLTAEGLFLAAFFAMLLVRALNPDLWHPARGGEKPMDLAFLTAVLRSASFPPYDPWFAGGYINYYYFGFVIVGTLVHLTGTAPAVAYNLAVPALFALTGLGAWGVAYNLAALRRGAGARVSSRFQRAERRAIAAGLVAAVFVALAGSLAQARWFLPGTADRNDLGIPAECREVASYAAQQACRGRSEWAFWDATRLVGMALQDSTITEFPFFTFLFADLHAHMIALPLALAALGLMVALVKAEGKRLQAKSTISSQSAFTVLSLALVVGALAATNTWDYPAYLGLGVLTAGLVAWRRWRQGAALGGALAWWAVAALALAGLSRLLFQPFYNNFATDYAGFELWRGERTPIAEFLTINGVWIFLLVSADLALNWRRGRARPVALGALAAVLAIALVLADAPALLLVVPLLADALSSLLRMLRRGRPGVRTAPAPGDPVELPPGWQGAPDERPAGRARASLPAALVLVWAVAGLGLSALTELVTGRGDIGRMNTVFKLGMQSWVLFALSAAILLVWLMRESARWPRPAAWAWRAVAAALVAAALVYPLTATPARIADRYDRQIGPTLDGAAYMRSPNASWEENGQRFTFAEDAAALTWMGQQIDGTPIVLEAQTEGYRWGGRVSVYTGLPTLLGWPWHETQQRSVAEVGPVLESRKQLVARLYNEADQAEALETLQTYGVEYVYVGQLERALYDGAGLAKFDAMAQAGQLEAVYTSGETSIYRVPQSERPPAVLTTSLPVRPPALPEAATAMLDRPVDLLPAVDEYAWNSLARSQVVAVLLWLLACYALLALGLPLAVLVFGRWRDGGYTWARLIGLLLAGYLVWMPVSAKLWQFDRLSLVLGALLVLAIDVALLVWIGRNDERRADQQLWPHGDADAPGRSLVARRASLAGRGARAVWRHLVAHKRQIALVEGLFVATFAAMLAIRALNPDLWQPIWGGEKPFEFGLLNAVLRSPVMPPYSPFFSGGTINYYYYGLFLVALPIKATGIAPAVAFNLVIPTLFALTATGAFTLAWQLTGRAGYGLIGAAFVALLGNLAAAFEVTGAWSQGLGPVQAALAEGLSGFGARLGDWFVGPSRVIPFTINEFPFWSFLFADLHPHLIALPVTLLVIGLAYTFVDDRRPTTDDRRPTTDDRRPTTDDESRPAVSDEQRATTDGESRPAVSDESATSDRWGTKGGWRELGEGGWGLVRACRWALAALALGALAVTNSWDFPTYGLLIAGAAIGAAWRRNAAGAGPVALRLVGAGAAAGAAGGLALLLYLPFFQNFVPMVGGIGATRQGTPLQHYLLVYGLFVAVLVPALLGAAWRVLRHYERRWSHGGQSAAELSGGAPAVGIVAGRAGASPLLRLRLLLVVGAALLVIVALMQPLSPVTLKLWLGALLLVGAPLLLNRRIRPAQWFAVLLATLAWAVSLGVELVYIRDHLEGGDWYRMNTVFKFGLQVWVLLALAAAAALPALLGALRRRHVAAEAAGLALLAGLAALALVFPLVGTPSRVAYRFPETTGPTLDGLAFMDQASYTYGDEPATIDLKADAEAIRWLNQEISGTPVVLQSSMEFYRAYGVRIAANTGLPTVVSPLHESEQRDGRLVAERDADVIRFYTTDDIGEALAILSKYRVGYVYVGPIERVAYGELGMAKFEPLSGTYLDLVYESAEVQIYRVSQAVYSAVDQDAIGQVEPAPPPEPQDQESLAALEQANRADPTAAGPAFGLGLRYRDQGRLDDAATVLAAAAAANPNDVALHHLWGDTLRDADRVDEAYAAYLRAAEAGPTGGNYNKLGVEALRMGLTDQALQAFSQATTIEPNLPEPYFHLGQIHEQRGQAAVALEHYLRFLSLSPTDETQRAEAARALERLQ